MLKNEDPNVKTSGLQIQVAAPGKAIIYGEHSVVYGKLALAASIDLRTKLKLTEIDEPNTFILQSQNLDFFYKFNLQDINLMLEETLPVMVDTNKYNWESPKLLNHEELLKKIEYLLEKSNIAFTCTKHIVASKATLYLLIGILGSTNSKLKPIHITTTAELTIGAGLGSSASFSVCAAAAFLQYVKHFTSTSNFSKHFYKPSYWEFDLNKFNEQELDLISQWSFCAEKIIHGTPSGLDNATCTYGSIVEYRKGFPLKLLNLPSSLNLLLINTNVSRETKKLVTKVANLHQRFPNVVNNILEAMEEISQEAVKNFQHLSNKDTQQIYDNLSQLFSINHNLLNSIGVGHIKLDEIVNILGKVGLRGKLTGAGGGGYAICLIPPNFDVKLLETVVDELISSGFEVKRTKLGAVGVRLETI